VWCVARSGSERRGLRRGQFSAATDQQILGLLDTAQDTIDEQAVMFLYATFEAALRGHIAAQAGVFVGVTHPTAQFGLNMKSWFADLCDDTRMNQVVDLFKPSVNQDIVAQVGTIRTYRHWLAHGKRGAGPPSVTPVFAYTTLTSFLQSCSLV